ncbi:hypothetical protein DFJ58DRAFT_916105 [Suillus subalutaceus]|uniref:uncharacterized protein n=1 Tax=Suillus subalutaceus TaxID=48586 RepID=UPI001B862CEF|nr:uncharacterized protein DFJ58DRAFT_916105 [Suillus subalutaceus]KAG1842877.1 hypothetical protein DFJ58DRAFT_916105 [Suillus subalutaceus]
MVWFSSVVSARSRQNPCSVRKRPKKGPLNEKVGAVGGSGSRLTRTFLTDYYPRRRVTAARAGAENVVCLTTLCWTLWLVRLSKASRYPCSNALQVLPLVDSGNILERKARSKIFNNGSSDYYARYFHFPSSDLLSSLTFYLAGYLTCGTMLRVPHVPRIVEMCLITRIQALAGVHEPYVTWFEDTKSVELDCVDIAAVSLSRYEDNKVTNTR